MPGSVTLRFLSVFGQAEVDRLREKMGSSFELIGVRAAQVHQLVSVADELICNILEHSKASWVEVGMAMNGLDVRMVLRDDGEAFDTAESIQDSSLERSFDDRHLGHYMVRQMASRVLYGREGGVNRLELEIALK
jgi:nitrate/nitrite-specific signal transduction histidine kinase